MRLPDASEPEESKTPLLSQLALEACVDPMVPKGYIEFCDADGLLLRRQWIGSDDPDPGQERS